MAVPNWFEDYLKRLHPDPEIALKISRLETKKLKLGRPNIKKINEEIERLKKLPKFEIMPVKKTTKVAATKKDALKKLTVPTLRAKAKRAGIKLSKTDGSQKTKAQLVLALDKVPTPKKKVATRKPGPGRKPASTTQVGTSNTRRDKLKQALAPGKRVSKTGRTYYERRANRSDKGQLLGEKYNGWTNYWTWRWNLEFIDDYTVMEYAQEAGDAYELAQILQDQAEQLVEDVMGENAFTSWMYTILKEINWREIAKDYYEQK
jgi:hypothetical protein